MQRWQILSGIVLVAASASLWLLLRYESSEELPEPPEGLYADGFTRVELAFPRKSGNKPDKQYVLQGDPGTGRILQVRHEDHRDVVVIRTGVVGGGLKLLAGDTAANGFEAEQRKQTEANEENRAGTVTMEVAPDWTDRNENGFPDNLELDSPQDMRAFLDWFRYLTEEQYYRGDALQAEIKDCAALLRFAYREALRKHSGTWANEIGLQGLQPIPDVDKYQYPFTPLRANLFRLRGGAFVREDLDNGAFGQFADAEHLLLYNASRIGKDIGQARPGDLLFYRQESQGMPFHAMVFIGPSMLEPESGKEYVLYHTGPEGKWPGEMRRRTVMELMRHPEARWHPVPANPAFLGVYRWKIVADGVGG